MTLPHVALIGTGGTISSLGRNSLDILDYGANDTRLAASQIAERVPELMQVAKLSVVDYRAIVSPDIDETDWRALVAECVRLERTHSDLAGIVITHGTSHAGGNRLVSESDASARNPGHRHRGATPAQRAIQ